MYAYPVDRLLIKLRFNTTNQSIQKKMEYDGLPPIFLTDTVLQIDPFGIYLDNT
jgi:hypothetical protein